jgi:hypothetical protein
MAVLEPFHQVKLQIKVIRVAVDLLLLISDCLLVQ